MNLGSPDSTSTRDVHRYLMEFLMDERVIDYPWLLRKILVRGIIVPFRAAKSAEAYQTIWTKEGSPLIVLTRQLQQALQQKVDAPVEIAMRYGRPSMEEAFEQLKKRAPEMEDVIAVPLYPHYAMASYETAVEEAREVHRKKKYGFGLRFVPPFYNEKHYLHALSEHIRPWLDRDYDHILFSYHGVPGRHIKKATRQAAIACNPPIVAKGHPPRTRIVTGTSVSPRPANWSGCWISRQINTAFRSNHGWARAGWNPSPIFGWRKCRAKALKNY